MSVGDCHFVMMEKWQIPPNQVERSHDRWIVWIQVFDSDCFSSIIRLWWEYLA